MIGVLGHYDDNSAVFLKLQPHGQKTKGTEVIEAVRTDDVRADASPCEQRRHLQLVDVLGLPLPAAGVDVDQQVLGSAG